MSEDKRHRNDIYGDLEAKGNPNPAIPAATVVLVREKTEGLEVLMLKKNTNISFGGMWVFPGGKIDAADHEPDGDIEAAARNAAIREAAEETSLKLDDQDFVWFAHWMPPATTPKRYATWFYLACIDSEDEIQVDGEEILNHQWISATAAIKKHAAGDIDLAPPTWISLYQISRFERAEPLRRFLDEMPEKYYATRVVKNKEGVRVAMWEGDAGYETSDPEVQGERHRLILGEAGFEFENTVSIY